MICSIYRYYLCQISLRLKETGKLNQFVFFFMPHLLTYSFFFRTWRPINPSYPEVCDIANIYGLFFYIQILFMPCFIKIESCWQAFQVRPFLHPPVTYSLFFRIWRLINPSYPEVCDIANIYALFFYIQILFMPSFIKIERGWQTFQVRPFSSSPSYLFGLFDNLAPH